MRKKNKHHMMNISHVVQCNTGRHSDTLMKSTVEGPMGKRMHCPYVALHYGVKTFLIRVTCITQGLQFPSSNLLGIPLGFEESREHRD